tara:strand:- start:509 stop:952 length:444 start_codon:yes stop_codon:yes gene_type:complete
LIISNNIELEINQKQIKLNHISKSDFRFLYNLLKERDPLANISHKKMPTYSEHISFISSKPYLKWYIIMYGSKKVGSIYLSRQNEIGIFIKKNFQNNQIGRFALELLIKKNPKKRYLANVNPNNKTSINFFKNHKFKLIQYTFELNN